MRPILIDVGFTAPRTCFAIADALAPEECAALVARAERGGLAATGLAYPPWYRNNDRWVLDDPALAERLFARLAPLLPATRGDLRLAGFNARFRFCRYRDGQRFAIHQDGAYAAPARGERSSLTCQFSLSEPGDFAGGHTRFYAANDAARLLGAARPQRGTALVFAHDLWHDGEAVPSGTKVVMRTDVIYRGDFAEDAPADPRARIVTRHDGYVFAAVVLADGAIATGSRDCTVRIVRPDAPGNDVRVIRIGDSMVAALAELRRGVLVAGLRDGTLVVIDVDGGRAAPLAHLGAAPLVIAVAAGSDGFVVAGSDGALHFVDARGAVAAAPTHRGWAWGLGVLDERLLVSAGDDGDVIVTDSQTRRAIARTALGASARSLAVLDRGRIAVGDERGYVHLLRFFDRQLSLENRFVAHDGEVTALAAAPGDTLVSAGIDGFARRFDGAGREHARAAHPAFVRTIAVHRGNRFVTGGYDGCVRLVELPLVHGASNSRADDGAQP